MRLMMEDYGRPDVDHIAILLTDGFATLSKRLTLPETEKAKAKNITMIVVGMLLLLLV